MHTPRNINTHGEGRPYDDNGNLIQKGSDYTQSGQSLTFNYSEDYRAYSYDLFNRLIKVEGFATTDDTDGTDSENLYTIAQYGYDSRNLRIYKKDTEGNESFYVFDQMGNRLELHDDDTDIYYVFRGIRHTAVRVVTTDGSDGTNETETIYFYGTDHLGSTVLITDEEGIEVWSGESNPFGDNVTGEGTLTDSRVIYTGKDYDEDIGLYYFNARWYDPEVGRFITEDPARDGVSWYAYVGNNPVRYVDPSGHRYDYDADYESWYDYSQGEGEMPNSEPQIIDDDAMEDREQQRRERRIDRINGIESKIAVAISGFENANGKSDMIYYAALLEDLFAQLSQEYSGLYDNPAGVYAAQSGVAHVYPVKNSANLDGDVSNILGNFVVIEHENGTFTLYGHLASFEIADGQMVQQGQLIGVKGNTSADRETPLAAHLHWGYVTGENITSIHIARWMPEGQEQSIFYGNSPNWNLYLNVELFTNPVTAALESDMIFPTYTMITSPYGPRDIIQVSNKFHTGTDQSVYNGSIFDNGF